MFPILVVILIVIIVPQVVIKTVVLVLNVHKTVLIAMLQNVSNVLMVSTMMRELVELVKVIV